MARIKKIKLADSISLLEFPTQYELTSSFLRIQEHYESSKFRGRTFTLEEYMDWYAQKFGNFTYFQDWDGFNVPSTAFEPFYSGRFDPLLKKEIRLLDLLRKEKGEFYVIGIVEGSRKVSNKGLQHELAHALYYVDPDYRKEAQRLLKKYDLLQISRELVGMGYHEKVVHDEVQAYMVGNSGQLSKSVMRPLAPLSRELRQVYRRHAHFMHASLA